MSALEPWLRLVRLPNLLTAPGDVVAGFLLAGGASAAGGWGKLGYAVGASVTLYAAGLILNDIVDRGIDARERPARPIPSGAVTVSAAGFVLVAAVLSALNLAVGAGGSIRSMPVAAAAALTVCIALYDSPLRHRLPLVGIGLMGLCRAANVALGASLCPVTSVCTLGDASFGVHSPAAYAGAFAMFLYVVAFSEIARHEMEQVTEGRPPFRFALPFFAVLAGLAAVVACVLPRAASDAPVGAFTRVVPLLVAFGCVLPALHALSLWRIYPLHVGTPEVVGRHVLNLMRLQAALVLASVLGGADLLPAACAAFALYLGTSLFRALAARFPPS